MRVPASLALALMIVAAGAPLHAQDRLTPFADHFGIETEILDGVNAFRQAHGLRPVSPEPHLQAAARHFADYLVRSGRFAHDADGGDPAGRAEAAGYLYCVIAENLADASSVADFDAGPLGGNFVKGWEHSPGHRENMLKPDVVDTGIAVARASGPTERYVAVQMFGLPRSAQFSFEVSNLAGRRERYVFDGRTYSLVPRESMRHFACERTDLTFPGQARPYAAEPGALYVLRPMGRGVQVQVLRDGGA